MRLVHVPVSVTPLSTVTIGNFTLPIGLVDSADRELIKCIQAHTKQLDAGLITEYEMIEATLYAIARWAAI